MNLTKSPSKIFGKPGEIVILNTDDIRVEIYAREKLDEDRVLEFALLFEQPDYMDRIPAIEITPDGSLIDGRQRLEGAKISGIQNGIRCKIKKVADKVNHIEEALKANFGGSVPPKKADIIMVIKDMIFAGASRNRAIEFMKSLYPPSVATKYVDEARHGINRDKMRDAKRDVLDNGLTIPTSAAKYGLDPERLREELGGRKKKNVVNAGDFNKILSTHFRSHGQKVFNLTKKVREHYQDGDIKRESVLEVYKYILKYINQHQSRMMEEIQRFENRTSNTKKIYEN